MIKKQNNMIFLNALIVLIQRYYNLNYQECANIIKYKCSNSSVIMADFYTRIISADNTKKTITVLFNL